MRTILGVLATLVALCLFPWALPAQVRSDSAAFVVLSANETDLVFSLWILKGSRFELAKPSQVESHSRMMWVFPRSELPSADSLLVVRWMRVGTHQMITDTIRRHPTAPMVYRRDFRSGKPEALQS